MKARSGLRAKVCGSGTLPWRRVSCSGTKVSADFDNAGNRSTSHTTRPVLAAATLQRCLNAAYLVLVIALVSTVWEMATGSIVSGSLAVGMAVVATACIFLVREAFFTSCSLHSWGSIWTRPHFVWGTVTCLAIAVHGLNAGRVLTGSLHTAATRADATFVAACGWPEASKARDFDATNKSAFLIPFSQTLVVLTIAGMRALPLLPLLTYSLAAFAVDAGLTLSSDDTCTAVDHTTIALFELGTLASAWLLALFIELDARHDFVLQGMGHIAATHFNTTDMTTRFLLANSADAVLLIGERGTDFEVQQANGAAHELLSDEQAATSLVRQPLLPRLSHESAHELSALVKAKQHAFAHDSIVSRGQAVLQAAASARRLFARNGSSLASAVFLPYRSDSGALKHMQRQGTFSTASSSSLPIRINGSPDAEPSTGRTGQPLHEASASMQPALRPWAREQSPASIPHFSITSDAGIEHDVEACIFAVRQGCTLLLLRKHCGRAQQTQESRDGGCVGGDSAVALPRSDSGQHTRRGSRHSMPAFSLHSAGEDDAAGGMLAADSWGADQFGAVVTALHGSDTEEDLDEEVLDDRPPAMPAASARGSARISPAVSSTSSAGEEQPAFTRSALRHACRGKVVLVVDATSSGRKRWMKSLRKLGATATLAPTVDVGLATFNSLQLAATFNPQRELGLVVVNMDLPQASSLASSMQDMGYMGPFIVHLPHPGAQPTLHRAVMLRGGLTATRVLNAIGAALRCTPADQA